MAHFLHSAQTVLAKKHVSGFARPSITVSLVEGQEARWDLYRQAYYSANLKCSETYPRPFHESEFPGYICMRNTNAQSFKNMFTKKQFSAPNQNVPKFNWMQSWLHRLEHNISESTSLSSETFHIERMMISHYDSIAAQPAQPKIACDTCRRSFLNEWGLSQHIARGCSKNKMLVPQTLSYRCASPSCPKMFKDEEACRQHFINKHTNLKIGEVPNIGNNGMGGIDGGSEVSRNDIVGHFVGYKAEDIDTGYTYIPCPICSQSIPDTKSGYEMHVETLKPLLGLQMNCPICIADQNEARKYLTEKSQITEKIVQSDLEGLDRHPRFKSKGQLKRALTGGKKYGEERALVQHYRFCRFQHSGVADTPAER